eukprot:5935781-Prymnesium_polylepis.1
MTGGRLDLPSTPPRPGPVWTFTPRVKAAHAAPSRESASQVENTMPKVTMLSILKNAGELEQLVGPAPSIAGAPDLPFELAGPLVERRSLDRP